VPKHGDTHRVAAGDCLTSLCFEAGYDAPGRVLMAEENAALRTNGRRVNMLAPGDLVRFPPIVPKWVPVQRGPTHRFRLGRQRTTTIRLELGGGPEGPWSRRPFQLLYDATTLEGMTDALGVVEVDVPIRLGRALLRIFTIDGSSDPSYELELLIGHLDPVEEISGVQARLNAIGFSCGPVDGRAGKRTVTAIRDFQSVFGLRADGIADESTRAALVRVHGC